jgi:hypothetical protein
MSASNNKPKRHCAALWQAANPSRVCFTWCEDFSSHQVLHIYAAAGSVAEPDISLLVCANKCHCLYKLFISTVYINYPHKLCA